MREIAAGRPGLMTKTGLHTFVDPRHGGGRQSRCAPDDMVELIDFRGEEYLFYRPFHIDVCFLRGTTADEDGNVTMEQEAVFGEMLSEAQATRRCGGLVIVQVKRMAKRGTLPAKQVKIPGILVDLVVVEPGQWQTYDTEYSPSYAGELKMPLSDIPVLPLDARKVIARRAAMELFPGAICNLGSGISTGIANVAAEEGVLDEVCLTNEQGLIGGAPAFRQRGGRRAQLRRPRRPALPVRFLRRRRARPRLPVLRRGRCRGARQCQPLRRPHRRARRLHQHQPERQERDLQRHLHGRQIRDRLVGRPHADRRRTAPHAKLVKAVEQITYSGTYGRERGQRVLYVTERAVFRLGEKGVELIEIAPGIDLERDVLARMDFAPIVSPNLREMDAQPVPARADRAGWPSRRSSKTGRLGATAAGRGSPAMAAE